MPTVCPGQVAVLNGNTRFSDYFQGVASSSRNNINSLNRHRNNHLWDALDYQNFGVYIAVIWTTTSRFAQRARTECLRCACRVSWGCADSYRKDASSLR